MFEIAASDFGRYVFIKTLLIMVDYYNNLRQFFIFTKNIISLEDASYIKNYVSAIAKSKLLTNDEKIKNINSFLEDQYSRFGIEKKLLNDTKTNVEENFSANNNTSINNNIYDPHFSFQKYIKDIDISNLIEKNTVFEEYRNIKIEPNTECFLCGSQILSHENLRLSDNNYLCVKCFKYLQDIKYPEKYQKLFENYILNIQAYEIAKDRFLSQLPYLKKIKKIESFLDTFKSFFSPFIFIFVLSFFVTSKFYLMRVIFGTLLLSIYIFINLFFKQQKNKFIKLNEAIINNWEKENPYPKKPQLKSFYDPTATLTQKDKKILHIFNHWPGYPPFWDYLKNKIHERDNQHCQVTGCPSRTSLHVHHRKPISKGGSHSPNNLVLLCAFHHGIQPDTGHERIWGNIKTDFFTLVHKHYRHNRKNSGVHTVRAHLRRLELVNIEDIKKINSYYRFLCPYCESPKLKFSLNKRRNTISVICQNCKHKWEGPLELAEETGPRLAEILKPSKNVGSCKINWEILSKRTENVWEK